MSQRCAFLQSTIRLSITCVRPSGLELYPGRSFLSCPFRGPFTYSSWALSIWTTNTAWVQPRVERCTTSTLSSGSCRCYGVSIWRLTERVCYHLLPFTTTSSTFINSTSLSAFRLELLFVGTSSFGLDRVKLFNEEHDEDRGCAGNQYCVLWRGNCK